MTKSELLKAQKNNTPVWRTEPWTGRFIRGTVKEFKTENNKEYVIIQGIRSTEKSPLHDFTGTQTSRFDQLFVSKEALMTHETNKDNEYKNKIRARIQTKEDMIQFLFNTPVACCEEYTDWVARETVKEIAFEKWGITLE